MGTRNLTVVVKDGEYKVAQYGQWDGQPSGQGDSILTFLRKYGTEELDKGLNNIVLFNKDDIEREVVLINTKEGLTGRDADVYFFEKYPLMSRDIGAEILEHVAFSDKTIYMENQIDFAADSLFCEFAYVIDLDKNEFEVYKGFNHDPLTEEDRFYSIPDVNPDYREDKYHPIKLIKSYPIDKLPTSKWFIYELDKLMGYLDDPDEVFEEDENILLKGGWDVTYDDKSVTVTNRDNDISFDIDINKFDSIEAATVFALRVADSLTEHNGF